MILRPGTAILTTAQWTECLVTGLGGTTVVSPAAGGSSGGIGPASALSTEERTVPGPLKNRPPVTRNRVQLTENGNPGGSGAPVM